MAKKKAPAKKKPGAKAADGGETRNGEPFISATKKTGRAGSKSAKVREYHKEHPKATVQEIATALGESYGTVYQALKKLGKKTTKAAKKTPKAKHTTNGHASVIETAAAFVASCGGLKSAQQVLEQLSIIGSH